MEYDTNEDLSTIKTKNNATELISKDEFEYRIKEIGRCKRDITYFAEKYFRIVTLNDGLQLIKLYPKQKELLKGIVENKRIVALATRQCGKCYVGETKVLIRNKKTGEISYISAEDLFSQSKK